MSNPTIDVAVTSVSGTVYYRYEEYESGKYRLLSCGEDGNDSNLALWAHTHDGPVAAGILRLLQEKQTLLGSHTSAAKYLPDGRMIHPPPPLPAIEVLAPDSQSLADQLGGIVNTLPHSIPDMNGSILLPTDPTS